MRALGTGAAKRLPWPPAIITTATSPSERAVIPFSNISLRSSSSQGSGRESGSISDVIDLTSTVFGGIRSRFRICEVKDPFSI